MAHDRFAKLWDSAVVCGLPRTSAHHRRDSSTIVRSGEQPGCEDSLENRARIEAVAG